MSRDLARSQVTPIPKPEKSRKVIARPKTAKPKSTVPADESKAWYAAVMHKRQSLIWTGDEYDQIAAGDAVRSQGHHIVSRQECRKHGAPEWDARNGVPVTKRRHERHHSRVEPIHRSELPEEIFAFLTDYPRLWPYFTRTYPEATSANVAEGDFATKPEANR